MTAKSNLTAFGVKVKTVIKTCTFSSVHLKKILYTLFVCKKERLAFWLITVSYRLVLPGQSQRNRQWSEDWRYRVQSLNRCSQGNLQPRKR